MNITDEMIEAGCKAHFGWYSSLHVTEQHKKIARAAVSDILTAALSLAPQVKETPSPSSHVALPQDVIALVIAAREFWDDKNDFSDEAKALDRALEAFASRVPYENEPSALEGNGHE